MKSYCLLGIGSYERTTGDKIEKEKINKKTLRTCANVHSARVLNCVSGSCLMAFKGPLYFFLLIIRPIHR